MARTSCKPILMVAGREPQRFVAPKGAACSSCFADLRGPVGHAAKRSRRGGACQAGDARAFAAAASRIAAWPQSWAAGQADAIAILIRRTLTRTSAPILSSLRRMVPQVAFANLVSWSPIRRVAHSRIYAIEWNHSRN